MARFITWKNRCNRWKRTYRVAIGDGGPFPVSTKRQPRLIDRSIGCLPVTRIFPSFAPVSIVISDTVIARNRARIIAIPRRPSANPSHPGRPSRLVYPLVYCCRWSNFETVVVGNWPFCPPSWWEKNPPRFLSRLFGAVIWGIIYVYVYR